VASDDIDFGAEGLLDGLEGSARDERLELLEWLVDEHGLTLGELRRATETGTPLLLPAGRALGNGDASLTARDVAQQAGIDVELLERLRRAQGFAAFGDLDTPMYGTGDVQAARTAAAYLEMGLTTDQIVATSRVLGRGLAQTANHMRQMVFEMTVAPGATERELAASYAAIAENLVPLLGPMLEQLLRLHLGQTMRSEVVTAAERAKGELPGARPVCIAFADLVGFTRLGEELTAEALEKVAERLERMADETIVTGVRLVKTLGDAVMLVSEDPAPLLEVCFSLVAAAEAEGEDFPQLRAGIASGPAVSRAGDWFGRPVNLASRVTTVARPGSILATEEVHDALAGTDGVDWSFVGPRKLKGVPDEVKLFRARETAGAAPEPTEPPRARASRARRRTS
jgi:adenylate cyclase